MCIEQNSESKIDFSLTQPHYLKQAQGVCTTSGSKLQVMCMCERPYTIFTSSENCIQQS